MNRSLTENQYAVFMTLLPNIQIRDQCIMLFLLHAGLRNGEVCSLNWEDICINQDIFHTIRIINGHSRKKSFRYVNLTQKLLSVVKDYQTWFMSKYGIEDPNSPFLITRNQKGRINQRDVQRIVTNFTKQNLQEAFCPHCLRHTFATRLLKCTNIRVVQQLLGHDSLTSTQIYTHPSSEDRKDAINQAF